MTMFVSLRQVMQQWEKLYTEYSLEGKNLLEGYDKEELDQLEVRLDRNLHPSFREVLKIVNLDNFVLSTISFGGGSSYLEVIDAAKSIFSSSPDNFLIVAFADGYLILVDNSDGAVYFTEDADFQPEFVSKSFEIFIRIGASIIYSTIKYYTNIDNEEEALDFINNYVSNNNLQRGSVFWKMLALRAI